MKKNSSHFFPLDLVLSDRLTAALHYGRILDCVSPFFLLVQLHTGLAGPGRAGHLGQCRLKFSLLFPKETDPLYKFRAWPAVGSWYFVCITPNNNEIVRGLHSLQMKESEPVTRRTNVRRPTSLLSSQHTSRSSPHWTLFEKHSSGSSTSSPLSLSLIMSILLRPSPTNKEEKPRLIHRLSPSFRLPPIQIHPSSPLHLTAPTTASIRKYGLNLAPRTSDARLSTGVGAPELPSTHTKRALSIENTEDLGLSAQVKRLKIDSEVGDKRDASPVDQPAALGLGIEMNPVGCKPDSLRSYIVWLEAECRKEKRVPFSPRQSFFKLHQSKGPPGRGEPAKKPAAEGAYSREQIKIMKQNIPVLARMSRRGGIVPASPRSEVGLTPPTPRRFCSF